MKNLNDFLYLNKGNRFVVSVYRKMFTPYEMDNKFSDETIYIDNFSARLVDVYELECMRDCLLKFERIFEDLNEECDKVMYEFYRLSEVSLTMIAGK